LTCGICILTIDTKATRATCDPATINLSSIAAGTGGFVINGDHSEGFSGRSVSSAGDVDGDGLDDLIVGAPKSSKPSPLTSPAEETAVPL
jgi:hypothetical protein